MGKQSESLFGDYDLPQNHGTGFSLDETPKEDMAFVDPDRTFELGLQGDAFWGFDDRRVKYFTCNGENGGESVDELPLVEAVPSAWLLDEYLGGVDVPFEALEQALASLREAGVTFGEALIVDPVAIRVADVISENTSVNSLVSLLKEVDPDAVHFEEGRRVLVIIDNAGVSHEFSTAHVADNFGVDSKLAEHLPKAIVTALQNYNPLERILPSSKGVSGKSGGHVHHGRFKANRR